MRAVSYCQTCNFRLPYCVRTDRRFCQERCRVWWYWHPGRKRLDFSPGGWGLPAHPGKGRPKTFAAALRELAAARQHAAELEAAAKAMQLVDHHLRTKLDELRAEAIQSRRELMKELESLQDELDEARAQLALGEEGRQETTELREQVASLTARLAETEDEAVELRSDLEEKDKELAELHSAQAQTTELHTEEVQRFQTQVATLIALRDHLNRQHAEMSRQRNEAVEQLAPFKAEATERKAALEQLNAELSAARALHERETANRTEELRALQAEAAAVAGLRDGLTRQNTELACRCDEASSQATRARAELATARTSLEQAISDLAAQRQRAEAADRLAAQRDDDLRQRHRDFAAAEKAHQETHIVAASESRSLRAETERRMAAEQRVEQLILDLEALIRERRAAEAGDPLSLDVDRQLTRLLAENREVRSHRDEIDAERAHLSARLLRWLSPGQYTEHAAAAGHEIDRDPLIQLKREEILVEHRYFAWQETHHKVRRARALDPEQTLIEQAYAAAMAARCSLVHKPHRKLKDGFRWVVIGFEVESKGELHLQSLARGHIARMERKMRMDSAPLKRQR